MDKMDRKRVFEDDWSYLKKIFYKMLYLNFSENPEYWRALLKALEEEVENERANN